jgi:hypothetical protein
MRRGLPFPISYRQIPALAAFREPILSWLGGIQCIPVRPGSCPEVPALPATLGGASHLLRFMKNTETKVAEA